ncbi:hypothetical protein PVAG01_08869 [Phlyctema vagabunda]|uniref:Rhodopsin domain-containing protein n=1 Tax=Phlyctema vagabunda TaxID=108571 RepID=A0ABR4PAM3_9HELO
MIPDEDPAFIREIWALYGLGVAILLARFFTRIKTVGIRGFQGDDYLNVFVLAFYTIDAVMVHLIYFTGSNVEASVEQLTRTLTAEEIAGFESGSKEQLVAWYSYTALIWCMKASMLFFFQRLTVGLWQYRLLKWLGLICGLCYIAVFLTITFGCYPIQRNWQVVPDPGLRCTLKLQNFLTAAILNVLTDALILAIPIPLLWALKVPLQRKIVIGLLLCSGLFVIAAAIIRVALTLGSNPSALNINRWGVRETIVGIVCINLPILRPLLNKSFWTLSSFKSSSLSHGASHNLHDKNSGGGGYELSSHQKSKGKGSIWREEPKQAGEREDSFDRVASIGGDSQEYIIQGNKGGDPLGKGVTVERTFQVESEDVETGQSRQPWKFGPGATVHVQKHNGAGF